MKKLLSLAAVLAATALVVVAVVAPAAAKGRPAAPSPSLVDTAIAANAATGGQFSVLLCLVTRYPDLVAVLSQRGQHTVFAPTNAAFAQLGLDDSNCAAFQEANAAAVREILAYHVAVGRRDAASVASATRIRMLNGRFARISVTPDGVFVNASRIVLPDVAATNGIIHVIDAVLIPPTA
ncbi:MAG: fasciclin domain-containing protein [Thermoleophilia bacterium]|nr:fasciclin domain-containing protein [Thermoleophilia bacterium]